MKILPRDPPLWYTLTVMSHKVNPSFLERYFEFAIQTISTLDKKKISNFINLIEKVRLNSGKLVIVGLGGSAANASHLVNDFRKLCRVNAFCPTDNISEFSARFNDENPKYIFNEWINTFGFGKEDAIIFLSVGGGSRKPSVSESLIELANKSRNLGGTVMGILGRDGGEIAKLCHSSIIIQIDQNATSLQTPINESLQLLIGHSIVFDPRLKIAPAKW